MVEEGFGAVETLPRCWMAWAVTAIWPLIFLTGANLGLGASRIQCSPFQGWVCKLAAPDEAFITSKVFPRWNISHPLGSDFDGGTIAFLSSDQCFTAIAQLVKRVNGFEKYKKWAKLDPCFSFNKPTKQEILHFLGWSWPKFCPKKISSHCWKENFAKIMVNVQKSLKGGSVQADFLYGENIDHAEKKPSK